MILIDDHCHLMHKAYSDLDKVINNARKAGVKAIICSGINPPTNREALEIAKKYPDIVRVSLGIYPVDAIGIVQDVEAGLTTHKGPIDLNNEFEFIKKNKDKIAAVGEIGLDYHWVKDPALQKQERDNFASIIEFAEKLRKPIIVHTRKAEQDCINMLTSSTLKKVVLHCFEGKKSLIQRAADTGYIFSIPTSIARSQHFQIMAEMAPINQITTETDGPYLSPDGSFPNMPENVKGVIEKIAQLKNFTPEEVANNVWLNFQRIYG
ncbi:MAG: TatD family hydrolase [Candidatus Woesearchaeota archaeon]